MRPSQKTFLGRDAAIYDTNTQPHHHLIIEDTGEIRDIACEEIMIGDLPQLPPGLQLISVDVILRAGAGPRPEQA